MAKPTLRGVAILGLGLMGGALGLAVRRSGLAGRVTAYARRKASRSLALELGVADAVFDTPAKAVRGAELVVLCTPVLTIAALLERCRGALAPGAVVTDVGSTKQMLVETLGGVLQGSAATFVGSHPMCGSEQAGLEAADATLYDEALVIVTPAPDSSDAAVERVTAFWEALGSRVSVIPPDVHDRILARTSHLPHMVAAALAATVGRDGPGLAPYCGAGFRDTSRIAEGPADVWHDIVASNAPALLHELEAYHAAIGRIRDLVAANDFAGVRDMLATARSQRLSLCGRDGPGKAVSE